MRQTLNRRVFGVALGMVLLTGMAKADVLITDFNNFVSDALYPSWALPSATIISGADSYSITAIGYGSNYKYIEDASRQGAGYTKLELTVTLSGPAEADGHLGPIVTLIDMDGTKNNYAWYGQTLGSHVLTMDLSSPTWTDTPLNPGLDPNALQHMHMQLDPGGFGSRGAYTIEWENLALTGFVPEPSSLLLLSSGLAMLFGIRRR